LAKGTVRLFIEDMLSPLTDEDHGIFTKMTKSIQKQFSKLADWFGDLFKKIGDSIGSALGKMKDFFGGGTLGAIATGGVLAGSAFGISSLVSRFTRRGREKVSATGAAEDLSDTVWKDIIPDGFKRVMEKQNGPYLVDMIRNNRGGRAEKLGLKRQR